MCTIPKQGHSVIYITLVISLRLPRDALAIPSAVRHQQVVVETLNVPPDLQVTYGRAPYILFLEEVEGQRYLLILVGQYEGYQLAATLQQTESPRPMTYTFLANVLQAAQVTIREVHISRLAEDVFYATALVEGSAGLQLVDARPSDALNLAALTGAPIRVAPEVLDVAGVTIRRQTVRDDTDQEVIEVTHRLASTGEEISRIHLDPITHEEIRVLVLRTRPGFAP